MSSLAWYRRRNGLGDDIEAAQLTLENAEDLARAFRLEWIPQLKEVFRPGMGDGVGLGLWLCREYEGGTASAVYDGEFQADFEEIEAHPYIALYYYGADHPPDGACQVCDADMVRPYHRKPIPGEIVTLKDRTKITIADSFSFPY